MVDTASNVPVEGVAVTAIGVAVIRARETERADRLYGDPLARAFVDAARAGFTAERWAQLTAVADQFYESRTVAVRLVDDRVGAALDAGIRQIVLLGAGLDTRAFRLGLPRETVVFEIDLPDMFAFKEPVLDHAGAVPTCLRRVVATDLRHDWRKALLDSGFRVGVPTCWVDEGTLGSSAQEWSQRVVATLTELSAPGSLFGVARFSLEIDFDVERWLSGLGWATEFRSWNDTVAPLGRPVTHPDPRVGTIAAVRRPSSQAQQYADQIRRLGVKRMVVSVEAAKATAELLRRAAATQPPENSVEAELVRRATTTRPPTDFAEKFAVSTEVTTDARGNEWMVHTATARDRVPERTIVYVHGGGWVMQIADGDWFLCGELITNAAARVVIPLYPLVPEGTGEFVPDTIADITAQLITDNGAGNVSLIGDSVGATITLSAAQILRDRGVPNPHLTVLIAPTLDIRLTEPELEALDKVDPFLSPAGCRYLNSLYRGGLSATDARVSPMLGNNDHLGRLLLFSGTHDILNCQARKYAALAPNFAGTHLEYHEASQMIHIWVTSPTPEGQVARETIYRALRQ
ncbi:SAM-dependent methyltransferase [Nocardia terpenica]|nr:SAM-dependent methyltransferase [Nocardia terpenica]MBF6064965.1 SAM-dependent methyltransferase [Nocardia terpenica]MBF6115237.1 SAM-dependent methyltransferase [Nocardia terpenica]MBF6122559.1 SAM-dependent methyltransferase [Nocardia terpenica]